MIPRGLAQKKLQRARFEIEQFGTRTHPREVELSEEERMATNLHYAGIYRQIADGSLTFTFMGEDDIL
eukprot:12900192-Prorocentrum_lima.AAC.1